MPQNPTQEPTPPAADAAKEPFTTPVVEELGSIESLTLDTISGGSPF